MSIQNVKIQTLIKRDRLIFTIYLGDNCNQNIWLLSTLCLLDWALFFMFDSENGYHPNLFASYLIVYASLAPET
jgi:hypothetical protein